LLRFSFGQSRWSQHLALIRSGSDFAPQPRAHPSGSTLCAICPGRDRQWGSSAPRAAAAAHHRPPPVSWMGHGLATGGHGVGRRGRGPVSFRAAGLARSFAGSTPGPGTNLPPRSGNSPRTLMIIFDQLRKNDPALRLLALVVFLGLAVLLTGLWWVQIVCARSYQTRLETQSIRTVAIPPARGRILDHNGVPLAENRPSYQVSLYFEELRPEFDKAYYRAAVQARGERTRQMEQLEARLKRKLTRDERRHFVLSAKEKNDLRQRARFEVASNLVMQLNQR